MNKTLCALAFAIIGLGAETSHAQLQYETRRGFLGVNVTRSLPVAGYSVGGFWRGQAGVEFYYARQLSRFSELGLAVSTANQESDQYAFKGYRAALRGNLLLANNSFAAWHATLGLAAWRLQFATDALRTSVPDGPAVSLGVSPGFEVRLEVTDDFFVVGAVAYDIVAYRFDTQFKVDEIPGGRGSGIPPQPTPSTFGFWDIRGGIGFRL